MIFYYRDAFIDDTLDVAPEEFHFRYGLGFFETLFYNGHMLRHLELHLERLFGSMETFGLPYAKAPFEEIVVELVERNGLNGDKARVNIFYPVRDVDSKAKPLVGIAPWKDNPEQACFLTIYPWHHLSYLNAHKSMNYMHYSLARRFAQHRQCDDALLTDSAGHILETSTCALLFSRDGKNLEAPASKFALGSVALKLASAVLPVREKPLHLDDLPDFKHVYVLNSLIGMRPVRRIGETLYELDPATCELGTLKIL